MTQKAHNISTTPDKRQIEITRILDAPRELVWKAWTDPEQIVKWWGPNGFSNTLYEMDVRPNGVWRHMMHGPDGTDYPNKVVYLEVIKPERLVYTHGDDKKTASPCQFHVTVTFENMDGKTKLTLCMLFETEEERNKTAEAGAIEGGNQTFARLAAYLEENEPTFIISRTFNAPRTLVWKAWTDPALFAQWFGPKGFTCEILKHELRPGGIAHSRLTAPDGSKMWGKFIYKEIKPMERLSWIHGFSDAEGNRTRHPMSPDWPLELLTIVTFEDDGPNTKISLSWTPMNANTKETQVFKEGIPGMNQGWGGTFDQFSDFLAKK